MKREETTKIRIGVPINYLCSNLDPEIEEAFNRVKSRLTSLSNISLIPLDLTNLEHLTNQLGFKLILYESRSCLVKYLNDFNVGLSLNELIAGIQTPDVKQYFEQYVAENAPNVITEQEYEKLIEIRKQLIEEYRRIFENDRLDAMIYPTLSCLPLRFDEIREPYTDENCCRNSLPSSLAGLPSLSIPMSRSSRGLPIGLQIDAQWNRDTFLLDLGKLVQTSNMIV